MHFSNRLEYVDNTEYTEHIKLQNLKAFKIRFLDWMRLVETVCMCVHWTPWSFKAWWHNCFIFCGCNLLILWLELAGVWTFHCHFERHLSWGMIMAFITENGIGPNATLPPPKYKPPVCHQTTSTLQSASNSPPGRSFRRASLRD